MNNNSKSQEECVAGKETGRKDRGKRIGLVLAGTFMMLCLSLTFNAVFHCLPDRAESVIIVIVGIIVTVSYVLQYILEAIDAAGFISGIFKQKL